MWRFEWRSRKYLTDLFPDDEFVAEADEEERVHQMEGRRGSRRYLARYKATIRGKTAKMDYFPCRENTQFGFEFGHYKIEFSDETRVSIAHVHWWPRGATSPVLDAVDALQIPDAPSMNGPGLDASLQTRLSRPEQPRFRHALELAYGARCCVTGCGVGCVLEAAHITPYDPVRHEHVSNGLLLRADLHALFDAGHLAIDPDTRKVYFSPEALTWPEYAQLHASATLRAPQRGHEAATPPASALRPHWIEFCSEYGPEPGDDVKEPSRTMAGERHHDAQA